MPTCRLGLKLGTVLRLFIALDLDDAFLDEAAALAENLQRSGAPPARWVARSGMHLTVRFLGETEEALVPALGALVTRAGERRRAIEVRATSLLAFPQPRRARVLGLHLESDGEGAIADVAAEIERGVVALGFTPEERPYRAHLTVARMREPADLRRVIETCPVSIAGRIESLTLYRSQLGQGPPMYTPLTRATLSR